MSLIKVRQLDNEQCKAIATILENGPYKDFSIEGGIIKNFVGGKQVLLVSETMQRKLIRTVHATRHFGAVKVMDIIISDYYIPKLAERTKDNVTVALSFSGAKQRQKGRTT